MGHFLIAASRRTTRDVTGIAQFLTRATGVPRDAFPSAHRAILARSTKVPLIVSSHRPRTDEAPKNILPWIEQGHDWERARRCGEDRRKEESLLVRFGRLDFSAGEPGRGSDWVADGWDGAGADFVVGRGAAFPFEMGESYSIKYL